MHDRSIVRQGRKEQGFSCCGMFRRHATLVLALLLALALTTEAAKAKKRAKKSNIKNLEDGVKIEQVKEIGNLGFDTRCRCAPRTALSAPLFPERAGSSFMWQAK